MNTFVYQGPSKKQCGLLSLDTNRSDSVPLIGLDFHRHGSWNSLHIMLRYCFKKLVAFSTCATNCPPLFEGSHVQAWPDFMIFIIVIIVHKLREYIQSISYNHILPLRLQLLVLDLAALQLPHFISVLHR